MHNGRRINWRPESSAHALEVDMQDQVQHKSFWKALKRLYSIARIKHNVQLEHYLLQIFNGSLGSLASVIAELEALHELGHLTSLPVAKVLTEIDGIIVRMGRLAILDESLHRQLKGPIEALQSLQLANRKKKYRDELSNICAHVRNKLNRILNDHSKAIYEIIH